MFFRKKISTPQQNIERTTQDIRVANGKKILNLKRRKRLYFASGTIFAAILLFSGAWLFYALEIKAEVAQFYPSSCLGGWQNPYNAHGKPDLGESANSDEFNQDNSAILINAISELYCGNFQGDEVSQDTEPKQATLKFSWAISDKISQESTNVENINPGFPTITVPEETSTSPDQTPPEPENAPSSEPPSNNNSMPAPETAPENTPKENNTTPESTEPSALLPFLANYALAEEIPDNPENQQQATPETQTDETPPIDIQTETPPADIQTETAQENSTSSPTEQFETATTSSSEIPTPSTDFLEILYTIDGTSWQTLGKINLDNWKNLTLVIPEFQWEDLSNIQIKLQSFSTNGIPLAIYLDGLWLEVEYQETISNIESENSPSATLPAGIATPIMSTVTPAATSTPEMPPVTTSTVETATSTQTIIMPLKPPKERKFAKTVRLDKSALHKCSVETFRIDISGRASTSAKIILVKDEKQVPEEIEIGSLPIGIDITFLNNANYSWSPAKSDNATVLQITNQTGSQKGNFSIPIIYQNGNSTTVCQINVINQ